MVILGATEAHVVRPHQTCWSRNAAENKGGGICLIVIIIIIISIIIIIAIIIIIRQVAAGK